jgi:hypothetical protein
MSNASALRLKICGEIWAMLIKLECLTQINISFKVKYWLLRYKLILTRDGLADLALRLSMVGSWPFSNTLAY